MNRFAVPLDLDTWFSRLGARIADPHAFRPPAADDTPAPVQALAEQLSRDARADADRALSDERARSQAQFLSQAQTASRLEARALALQERLDRVEAERLRVRIRERRAGGAGVGSRLRGNDGR